MSNDRVNMELDIVLAPDHGNAAGLTHSALFKLSNGSEFETVTYKIKNEISVIGGDTENDGECHWCD